MNTGFIEKRSDQYIPSLSGLREYGAAPKLNQLKGFGDHCKLPHPNGSEHQYSDCYSRVVRCRHDRFRHGKQSILKPRSHTELQSEEQAKKERGIKETWWRLKKSLSCSITDTLTVMQY